MAISVGDAFETYKSVAYVVSLILDTSNLKFNHCRMVWNHYISTGSSELSAQVAILRDVLLFREDRSLCIDLFDTDEIVTAIKCICTE